MKKTKKWTVFLLAFFIQLSLFTCFSMQAATSKASDALATPTLYFVKNGKRCQKIKWKKVTDATHYKVYVKVNGKGKWKYLGKSARNIYTNRKNLKPGTSYTYTVRACKNKTTGKCDPEGKSLMYSTDTVLVNPTYEEKVRFIFGRQNLFTFTPGGHYKDPTTAMKNMVTIQVKTWDFVSGRSGVKCTKIRSLVVHKKLAETVKIIFEEIYNGKEKFPINALGGYRWDSYKYSEHIIGTAIDINPNENYMVNIRTKVITAGSYWKPKVDPYSIPKNGEVAKIFRKYGFSQGDWGDSKDYMHFSFYGT